MPAERETDVLVIGGGCAGLCAALAARETGARVLMVDIASSETSGGNTAFATGTLRTAYSGLDDLQSLVPDLSVSELSALDIETYTQEQYFLDLGKYSQYRSDVELIDKITKWSLPTLLWLQRYGLRYGLMYGRQSFKIGGRVKFVGGLVVEVVGGGAGLMEILGRAAKVGGIETEYETGLKSLIEEDGFVRGASVVDGSGKRVRIRAQGTILATGGFEGNGEWRARYLGPKWDLARVRGSRFSQGEGIGAGLAIGATPWGNWSGCHSVLWDANAPMYGDQDTDGHFARHGYPYGVVVNSSGERFIDEGSDFRNYTYARYGAEVLRQPEERAWQLFDGKSLGLLQDEYRSRKVTKIVANSVGELAAKMDNMNRERLETTVSEFNASVDTARQFNPSVKDGRGTLGLNIPKSNWASTLDTPPYHAYEVTCGITFTYGGLHIDDRGQVLDVRERPIRGLYAAGGVVGGVFYGNAPSGSSLVASAVEGRIAGTGAGRLSNSGS